jgi:hypothetical protein
MELKSATVSTKVVIEMDLDELQCVVALCRVGHSYKSNRDPEAQRSDNNLMRNLITAYDTARAEAFGER